MINHNIMNKNSFLDTSEGAFFHESEKFLRKTKLQL